jgi:hypothetical protein
MLNYFNYNQYLSDERSQMEAELLESILTTDDPNYPWNPADIESELFFNTQEEIFRFEPAEMEQRSQHFFAPFEYLWSNSSPPELSKFLSEHFLYVPQNILTGIAEEVKKLVSSNLSLIEQLVKSVQPVLTNWVEDDLMVIARPLAFNMRSKTTENANLANLSNVNWDDLSELEKARFTMAIARFALNEIKDQ